MKVVFILGSKSDLEFIEGMDKEFAKWNIPGKVIVASAHKVPEKVYDIVKEYNEGDEDIVYVTVAGRSNGLSGVTAANSVHPVIALPPHKTKEDFMVNINSTLQMPSDTPVMTIIDKQNVVMAIVRIFALKNDELKRKLADHIKDIKAKFN